jgi:hypothetical protein
MKARAICAAGLLAVAPIAAFAFETVDTLPWPSTGAFPVYGGGAAYPWGFYVETGAMYDDNVLRRPADEQSDSIIRLAGGLRSLYRVYGRQRLALDARVEGNKYVRFNDLDHIAYGLRADWLWELGNDLSGTAGYRRTHRLADPAETGSSRKEMITEDRVHVLGAYRLGPNVRLTGGAEYGNASGFERLASVESGVSLRGGIEYVTPLGNSLGVEARRTRGDAPVSADLGIGAFPDNRFTLTEYAARLSYGASTDLHITGRLGRTEIEYTDLPARNFSGTTGRGGVAWRPGVKVLLVLEVYKEPAAILDADALYVLRKGVGFGPSWSPTVKLVFAARMIEERRQYQGDPTIALGAPLRDETLRFIRFGAGWEPERRWQLGASFDYGERESNTLGRNYVFHAVVANVRYTF